MALVSNPVAKANEGHETGNDRPYAPQDVRTQSARSEFASRAAIGRSIARARSERGASAFRSDQPVGMRSLSPALEGDLAAFGPFPDFARAVERVGEVEQGGAALPFALGKHFGGSLSQRLGIQGALLCGPFGFLPGSAIDPYFHASKLRASVVARQCDAFGVLHPENVQ